jgi:hypothetical protein
VKECDPAKFSQEMGPHYVSCILSLHKDGGEIIPVLKHHIVEMCKDSVDEVPHICMHITEVHVSDEFHVQVLWSDLRFTELEAK